ncbi:hypothetical protein [Pseudomonas shirazensis]
MKKQKLHFLFNHFLLPILETNYVPHCDDEDYTRVKKELAFYDVAIISISKK